MIRYSLRLVSLAGLLHCGLLFSVPAFASGGPPMLTDDTGTPGDGHWEINLATLASRTDSGTTYQLPLVDANYGIGERVQVKLEMPWVRQDAGGASESGLGNGLAGLRWRFYDEGEQGWQISTYPQVQFAPSSAATRKGLAESGTATLLPFEFVYAQEGWDVNVELGRWFRPAGVGDSWIAGLVLTRELRKGFEVMAELHEEKALQSSQNELVADLGARWDMSEHTTLLVSAGRDLHNTLAEKNNFLGYLGVQLRF